MLIKLFVRVFSFQTPQNESSPIRSSCDFRQHCYSEGNDNTHIKPDLYSPEPTVAPLVVVVQPSKPEDTLIHLDEQKEEDDERKKEADDELEEEEKKEEESVVK